MDDYNYSLCDLIQFELICFLVFFAPLIYNFKVFVISNVHWSSAVFLDLKSKIFTEVKHQDTGAYISAPSFN